MFVNVGNILVNCNSDFKGVGIMIFIVKPINKRSEEELHMLHNRLVDELGDMEKSKRAVLCLPADCTYDCINTHNLNDVKVVVANLEDN